MLSTHCCDSMSTTSASAPGSRALTCIGDDWLKRFGSKRSSKAKAMVAGVAPMLDASPRSSGGTGFSRNLLLTTRWMEPSSVS